MFRRIVSVHTLDAVKMSVRCAGDVSSHHGTYESEVVTREMDWKRRRRVRDLIKAEREYVESLPGITSDEYQPSLQPGTINLRSMHPPYYSPLLKNQTEEQTAAAWQKMNDWQARLSAARGADRLQLVQEYMADFALVYVYHGDPLTDVQSWNSTHSTEVMKVHGIVRGVEGYAVLNVAGDEDLEETVVELSENTWMPQVWAGGEFAACWRGWCELHNSGAIVQLLEKVGLSSKLKGCYYDGKTPLVLH